MPYVASALFLSLLRITFVGVICTFWLQYPRTKYTILYCIGFEEQGFLELHHSPPHLINGPTGVAPHATASEENIYKMNSYI